MTSGKWARGKERRPELMTARWKKLSLQVRREEPLCRPCSPATPPRVTLATQVDHIDESNPDFYDRANLQPICMQCNIAKEMKRKGYTYTPRKRVAPDGWPIE
jgi:5-methylcytosine-specific restriction endonuclease McrA